MIQIRLLQEDETVCRIKLREWSRAKVKLDDQQFRDLMALPRKLVQVQPLPGGYTRVTTGPIAGRIRVGEIDVLILPKCEIPTLFMLLASVHRLANLAPELAGYGETTDIVDLLVQIFLQKVDTLIRRGLKRSYLGRDEELAAVRGRIDVRQTADMHLRGRAKVACHYEEYTLDGQENQTLLAALWAIARNPALSAERRRMAHRLTVDFADVSLVHVEPVDPASIQCDRLTKHYEPVLRMAHVILRAIGIKHEFGELEASGFLLNMNNLFEQFVGRRLRSLLGPEGISVMEQNVYAFDESKQATIRPDLLLRNRGGRRLIADTKYKLTSKPGSADLYQILAYCRILRISRAILITAGTGPTRRYDVRDKETVIKVVPVNLDGPIEDVEHSMERLADEVREFGELGV